MGGNAFQSILGTSAFPRMSPSTFLALRRHVEAALSTRFHSVSFAREDPAKTDFGDLDVVLMSDDSKFVDLSKDKTREELSALLKAEHAMSNGKQFITFAIRSDTLRLDESEGHEQGASQQPLNSDAGHAMIYHQVDINLVSSEEERDNLVFYDSYGDVGMILSLLTKPVGLSYSRIGLKIIYSPYRERLNNQPFYLTTSTKAALEFLGYQFDEWERGFKSRKEIFDWIFSSRFADRDALLRLSPTHPERPMYQEFLRYLENDPVAMSKTGHSDPVAVMEEALQHFGKKEEYYSLAQEIEKRKAIKEVIRGRKVMEVTGLEGAIVGKIIRKVKETVPAEELITKSQEEIKALILEALSLLTSESK